MTIITPQISTLNDYNHPLNIHIVIDKIAIEMFTPNATIITSEIFMLNMAITTPQVQ